MELADVTQLARTIFDELGLSNWHLSFDRAKKRAGICYYSERRVTFSRHLMALYDVDAVRETILHEAAHALVGPGHGHNRVWQAKAREIGASGRRTLGTQTPRMRAPWIGVCINLHEVQRFRKPSRVITCGNCSRRFNLDYLFSWSFQGTREVPTGAYSRELRRLQRGFGKK